MYNNLRTKLGDGEVSDPNSDLLCVKADVKNIGNEVGTATATLLVNDKEIESLRSWWSSSWYGKNAAGAVMPIRSILPVSHRSKIRTIPVRRLSRRMNRKYAVQEPRIWRALLTGNPQQHAKNRRICCPRIVKIALQELQNPRSQNSRN